jgi:AcrR family transcriptional regulator
LRRVEQERDIMAEARRQRIDLREACLDEALAIIRESGIENLSLREVARRLGVSHQAPYRHYPSRDHLLAVLVDRVFREFDVYLGQAGETEDPRADLAAMGRLYLDYALQNPLEYRLMFGAPLPSPEDHPEMLECGCAAFDRLRAGIARILKSDIGAPAATLEAMFVWSTIHGLASILDTDAMAGLGIEPALQEQVERHVLGRIDKALPRPE